MKKTYLDIPSSAYHEFAKSKGAQWDSYEEKWYVEGDVHVDLLGFLPKPKLAPKVREMGPKCPKCSCATFLQETKKGAGFWSCSNWPKCDGAISLDSVGSASEQLPTGNLSDVDEVLMLAIQKLGSKQGALNWLGKKKLALQGKSPAEVIKTTKGCETVKKLLLELYS